MKRDARGEIVFASKLVECKDKRFSLRVRQEESRCGKMIKVNELADKANGWTRCVFLGLSAAKELRDHLAAFYRLHKISLLRGSTQSSSSVLKSELIERDEENRRYQLGLTKGFLEVIQSTSMGEFR